MENDDVEGLLHVMDGAEVVERSVEPQDIAGILGRDWRPWAYAALSVRAPAAWTTVVREHDLLSIVPDPVAEGGNWKMHQSYLWAVLRSDSDIWIAKPTQVGNRLGVTLRAESKNWAKEHGGEPPKIWTLPGLLATLLASDIPVPDTEWLEEIAAQHWEIYDEDARAVAILIELLCLHLDGDPTERRLHLVG
jgi:hypothetical protein